MPCIEESRRLAVLLRAVKPGRARSMWTIAGIVSAMTLGALPATSALESPGVHHAKRVVVPVLRNHVREAGLRTPDLTYSGQGVDVDRDGDQDLFISNHTRGGSLWRN